MPAKLRLEFEVATPLFLGGAEQAAELRPPALKGLLRFWYRAADPAFMNPDYRGLTPEEDLFGGTSGSAGQSRFLLRVEGEKPKPLAWGEMNVAKFSQGTGRNMRNGLIYLGFPFQMKGNEARTAIAPGYTFDAHSLLPRPRGGEGGERDARRLLAAWWLLAHLGGAGSRARRGFGALVLKSWQAEPAEAWPDLADLPLPAAAQSPAEGRAALARGLATIQGWFGTWGEGKTRPEHPHLGPAFRFQLLDTAYGRGDWAKALADMGAGMQDFRLRRAPDYQMVKDHLLAQAREGGRFMQTTPPRATFGLPLTFRYTSLPGKQTTLAPYDGSQHGTHERHGSLLFMRPVAIGGSLHPLYARLDGAVPGVTPPAAQRKQSRGFLPAEHNAMDAFFDTLRSGKRT